MSEENATDIELATQTLDFIGSLKPEQVDDTTRAKICEIVANLCDFQNRFARPILFLGQEDRDETLTISRPVPVLIKYNYAIKVPTETNLLGDEDGTTVDSVKYCYVNTPSWRKLVDDGALTGEDAKTPSCGWDWIKYLFDLFQSTKDEQRDVARRLAACWYNIATQIDLNPPPIAEELEDPMMGMESLGAVGQQLLQMIAAGGLGGGDYDSDDDGDFVDDEEQVDDDEIEEKEEKENKDEEQPEFKAPEPIQATEDDDEQIEEDDVDEQVDATEDQAVHDQKFTASEIQQSVLENVDKLKAYLPSPEHDMEWFKRTLKWMQGKTVIDETWFPWGMPPLKPYIDCLKSKDEYEVNHAKSIILVFQQHM